MPCPPAPCRTDTPSLRIEVEVRDKEELASVINKLNNIQGSIMWPG